MLLTGPVGPYAGRHPEPEELAEYADGQMLPEDASRIDAHLELCERCSEEADSYGRIVGFLSALPQHPVPHSFVLDELAHRRHIGRNAWPAWTSLAASLILALGMVGVLADFPGGSQSGGSVASVPNEAVSAPQEAAPETGDAAIQDTAVEGEAEDTADRRAGSVGDAPATMPSDSISSAAALPEGEAATAGADEGKSAGQETGYGIFGIASPVATIAADVEILQTESPTAGSVVTPVLEALASAEERHQTPAEVVQEPREDRTLATVLGTFSALAAGLSALLFVRGRAA